VAPPVTRIFLPESRFSWNTASVLSRAGSEETSYTATAHPAREAEFEEGTVRTITDRHVRTRGNFDFRYVRSDARPAPADVHRSSRSPYGDQRQVSLRRPSLPGTGGVLKEDAFEFGSVCFFEIKLSEQTPGKVRFQCRHRDPAVAGAEKSVEW